MHKCAQCIFGFQSSWIRIIVMTRIIVGSYCRVVRRLVSKPEPASEGKPYLDRQGVRKNTCHG